MSYADLDRMSTTLNKGNLTMRRETDAYRLGSKVLVPNSMSTTMFVGQDGKLTRHANSKTAAAQLQHEPEVPIFKRKDLLVRATDAMP